MPESPYPDARYMPFWPRVAAAAIDAGILLVFGYLLYLLAYGQGGLWVNVFEAKGVATLLINWVFPVFVTLLLWNEFQATPGKMSFRGLIVDAKTGAKPTWRQYLIRYAGYLLSSAPLLLGFLWIARDPRHQGWHDKLAGTVVIIPASTDNDPVNFDD